MILEGIVTTQNSDGSTNIAPMGPIVDAEMSRVLLRPFQTSQTYRNLLRDRQGVLHVTDDVLLIAQAAINEWIQEPETFAARIVTGQVLTSACRWYEFQVREIAAAQERTEISVDIVHTGRLRDFFGFNRAKHAVLEAAILATRVTLIPKTEMQLQLQILKPIIEKTAGPQEQQAYQLLQKYLAKHELQF